MPDGVPDGTVAVQYKYFGLQSQNDKIGPLPNKGPLHARSPGPQVIFRPHVTYPLMQSSDVVAGCAAVWPLMCRFVVVVSSCPIIITVSPEK